MKKPIIGVLPRPDVDSEYDISILYVFDSVRNAIIKSGGIPFIITPVNDMDYYNTKWNDFKDFSDSEVSTIAEYLDLCDGLFLPGGYKYTKFDKLVIELAIKKDMPILGVCLGMQSLAAYHKDFQNRIIETDINHKQDLDKKYAHKVTIDKDSLLYKIIGKEEIDVNSFHKREIEENSLFNTVARAEDGVIEAIEMPNKRYVIGVQWHPEKMIDYDNTSVVLMDSFIEEALKYKNEKKPRIVKV